MSIPFPRRTLASAVCVCLFPALALAQSPGDADGDDAVLVTATRQPMRASELLSDTTVVGKKEIEAAGPAATVTDLLARQPGIEVQSYGPPGSAATVRIRGMENKHTLVLIDGMRVGSASSGEATWASIPLQQIDHIEILRGAASSLYGADAMGGVIQLFTKKGHGKPVFFGEAGIGSHKMAAASAGFSGSQGGVSYSFNAAGQSTHGFSATGRKNTYGYNPDRDGFRSQSASGRLSWQFLPGQEIGMNMLYSEGKADYDDGPAADDVYRRQRLSDFSLYSKNRITDAWVSTLRIGQTKDHSQEYENHAHNGRFTTTQNQYQWQNDLKLPVGTALLALESREEKLSASGNYDKTHREVRSALAGWTGHLGANRFQFNVRHDDNSMFQDKTTGFAAYGRQLSPEWRANVSYGTSFRAPSFNDLYWPRNCSSYGCMFGNPNLKPEEGRDKEAALHYESGLQHVSLTVYQNDVKNLINWVTLPNFDMQPQNIDKARLRGATLAYEGVVGVFNLKASADYQDPRDRGRDKLLPYRSRAHGNISLNHAIGKMDWTLEWSGYGRRFSDQANKKELGGYSLVNLSAAYRFAPSWQVFGRFNNLLDKQYSLYDGYSTDGFNAFVGLRYQMR